MAGESSTEPTEFHAARAPIQVGLSEPATLPDDLDIVIDLSDDRDEPPADTRPWLSEESNLLAAGRTTMAIRRAVDIAGSVIGLILLAPLIVAASIAIKLTSPGPVIFTQRRVGLDGREFDFYKFRSMECDAEERASLLLDLNEISGPVFKIRNDPRTTPVGRFLRKASMDELPQLWNVLRGDMSLVGPRPPLPKEVAEYGEWEHQRLTVKPGLTCIWQVSGRSELDFHTWVTMDIAYIEEWTFWLDVRLLLRTIPAVLSARGAY